MNHFFKGLAGALSAVGAYLVYLLGGWDAALTVMFVLMGLDYDYVIKMLTKPVVVDPGDPEDVVAKKEAVAAAKEAILDYMKDGASFDDFVIVCAVCFIRRRCEKS